MPIFIPFAFKASGYDSDAQAFINAVVGGGDTLTDTEKDAVNTLVVTLKSDGIWTSMLAIYPFVGGTASSHKWNLKDPQNTDAAYRLTFSGGFTHSSSGVAPNGTNTFANTHLQPDNHQTLGDRHFSFYSVTANTSTGYEFGGGNGLQNVLITRYGTGNMYSGFSAYTQGSNTSSTGFYIANIGSPSGTQIISKNGGATEYSNTGRSDNVSLNTDVFMFADNRSTAGSNPIEYSSKASAFASFGDSLSSTERSDFYNAVQAFQTTLGRQV